MYPFVRLGGKDVATPYLAVNREGEGGRVGGNLRRAVHLLHVASSIMLLLSLGFVYKSVEGCVILYVYDWQHST